jgi:diguanylate cyclase (GGDEF)-like protein/PAS domain S-box-containing protein
MDHPESAQPHDERFLIFHPFNQQHTASLRDDLFDLLQSLDGLPDHLFAFHFQSSPGFKFLPQHFLLDKPDSQEYPVSHILHSIEDGLLRKAALLKHPLWIVLDMSWLSSTNNIFQQQLLLLDQLKHHPDLNKVHFIFHFNLSGISPELIQQSIPLYPYIYWGSGLIQNPGYKAITGYFSESDITKNLANFCTQDLYAPQHKPENDFFHMAFDYFPTPILQADYSEIFRMLNRLKHDYSNTWHEIIQNDLQFTIQALKKIKFVHANQTALNELEAKNETIFFNSFPLQPTHLIVSAFRDHLLQLAEDFFPAQFAINLAAISKNEINTVLDVFPIEKGDRSTMLMCGHHSSHQMVKGRLESLLYKIAQLVHTEHDLDSVYRGIHGLLNEIINARNLYIAIYDEENQMLDFPYHIDERDKFPRKVPLQNGKTEYVLHSGQTLWVNAKTNLENICQGKYEQIGAPANDWLGVPLITAEKSIGVLAIQTYDESILTENDKLVMEFCSSQIAHAITRKMAENTLKQNEQKLSQILMGNTVPTRVVDKNNHTIFFNRAYEKFCGIPANEMLGKTESPWKRVDNPTFPCLAELITAGLDDKTITAAYHGLISGHPLIEGAYISENVPIQTANGFSWVNITAAPLKDLDGHTTGAIENLHDITHRIRAEDHILTFKTVADHANMGMLILDEGKKIHYINPYLVEKLGYPIADLLQHPLSTIFRLQNQRMENLIDEMINGKHEMHDIEISMQTKDNQNLPFMINAIQVQTQLDQQKLISCSCFNLTNQKKREEALNRYANRLEILHKMDEAILESDSTEEIAHTAMHIFLQLVKFRFAGILEIHAEQCLHLYLAHYNNGKYVEESRFLNLDESKNIEKLTNFEILIAEEKETISRIFDECCMEAHDEITSCMMIPLIIKHNVIGRFVVGFTAKDMLSPEIRDVIKEVSRMIAIGIYQARLYEKIAAMATTDELTEIYNRRQLLELGERALAQARRYHKQLSVIVFDIDHFKIVNDNFGHPCGDRVLKDVVKRCQSITRQMDIFGRYGGDEFVIFLPETSLHEAKQMARRLNACVAEHQFQIGENEATISISVGISEFLQDQDTLTSLINQADLAMYAAKKSGRNRIMDVN